MPPKNIYRSRKVVSCKYCFYEKNDECQLRVCPYVAERITAKVINYEKLILEFFKGNQPRLFSTRLRKHCRTYRHFSYLSTSHRKLFEQTRDEIARITYTPVCGADLAILYLSTSDELMSKHIIPLITHAKQLSWRFESNGSLNAKKYAIFKTAKQFTKGDFEINPQEFLSSEFVPDSTFSLIINALLLANYGSLCTGNHRLGTKCSRTGSRSDLVTGGPNDCTRVILASMGRIKFFLSGKTCSHAARSAVPIPLQCVSHLPLIIQYIVCHQSQ